MLTPVKLEVLLLLARRLEGCGFLWAVTGSASFALQGMELPVHDVDIQTDETGAYEIARLFPDAVAEPVRFCGSGRIRSHFGRLVLLGEDVELMGAVQKRLENGAWEPPVALGPIRRTAELEGVEIPVLDMSYECAAYRALGRTDKARRMEAFLRGRI